jgi:GNAT superfamily N-acetyltransferase
VLDKSLPFYDIIMKLRGEALYSIPEPVLPEGYSFRLYKPGDEYVWARIESQVQEFPTHGKALEYYQNRFLKNYSDEVARRAVFVVDAYDNPVATATAWVMDSSMGRRNWLHWISAEPAQQGKGLGKAVIAYTLRHFITLDSIDNVYLHTQTWSHKAVHLYHKCGFQLFHIDHVTIPTDESPYYRQMKNAPEAALQPLEKVYSPELLQSLRDNAEYPDETELADGTPWMQ